MSRKFIYLMALVNGWCLLLGVPAVLAADAPPASGQSIQEMIDNAPGQVVTIGPGDYFIDEPIRIKTDNSGLCGTGRIIQRNPAAAIIMIEGQSGVRISGLTLTRDAGKEDCTESALRAMKCQELELDALHVIDNRSGSPAISFEDCQTSHIRGCSIVNYQAITIDDRTENELYGYAFRVIDGTGIGMRKCRDIQIGYNTIIEKRIYPNQETKEKNTLGMLTEGKKPSKKGKLAPKGDYANNWHQGSAILVTAPLDTDDIQIVNNVIRNAAQGIDIHADHVTCSGNTIDHAFIGIKCMHGARNVIISNNNVSHMDLWGLVMMPGSSSYPALAATADKPAQEANFTRGNIIANNVFSDFGLGYQYFNWKDAKGGVICLDSGQLPENPVVTDVILQGNIVYDTGKDQILVDGVPTTEPPRYEYAVFIATNPRPQGLIFANNIFHPGRSGVSNIPLEP